MNLQIKYFRKKNIKDEMAKLKTPDQENRARYKNLINS